MKKILLFLLLGGGLAYGFLARAAAIECGQNFPTSLNGYTSNCIIHSSEFNALEAKLGINGSAATSSLDYQLNSIFTSYASEIVKSTSTTGLLRTLNNLSDLLSTSTARTNLGLGDSATLASSTWYKVANNGSDITSTSSFRTSLGLLSAALQNVSAFLQVSNNGSDVNSSSTFTTNIGALRTTNNLSDLTSTSSARTNIGFKQGAGITIAGDGTITASTQAVAGSQTQVQYNDGANFAATSSFTFTSSAQTLTLNNQSSQTVLGTSTAFTNIVASGTLLKFFPYTGAIASYTIPNGITKLSFVMGGSSANNSTGQGGVASGTITVSSGQVYWVNVGGQPNGLTGGYNGGGSATQTNGQGGAGMTTLSATSTFATSTVIAVAAGGGGNGAGPQNNTGTNGAGGGTTGNSAQQYNSCTVATGGTQSAGGTPGSCAGSTTGGAGLAGQGGAGAAGGQGFAGGGGGGAGFFGGGGGESHNSILRAGPGAGGSSFGSSTVSNFSTNANANASSGYAYLIAGNNSASFSIPTSTLSVGGVIKTGGVPPSPGSNCGSASQSSSTLGTIVSVSGNQTAGMVTLGQSTASCDLNFASPITSNGISCIAGEATSTATIQAMACVVNNSSSVTLYSTAALPAGTPITYHIFSY